MDAIGTESDSEDDEPGGLLPLIRAGVLKPGDELTWKRPRKNEIHKAVVTQNGCLRIADGRIFTSPSPAASWPAARPMAGKTRGNTTARSCPTLVGPHRPYEG
jgi:Restriction Enzyme Adenine Methylase Associated